MHSSDSTGDRREILWADFDALDADSLLWWPQPQTPDPARAALVRTAVAEALTDKQREVVEAHYFLGLSQGAIARKLGITQQVVHKRLHGVRRGGRQIGGALARLRAALRPHVDHE